MTLTFDTGILSDLYKDAYGFRPDGDYFKAWEEYPDEFKQVIWDRLLVDLAAAVEKEKEEDLINSPSHYTQGGIETIDYMRAKSTPDEYRGHLRLSALKYLSRAGLKDDTLKDLKKAQWYVNSLVEFVENSCNGS